MRSDSVSSSHSVAGVRWRITTRLSTRGSRRACAMCARACCSSINNARPANVRSSGVSGVGAATSPPSLVVALWRSLRPLAREMRMESGVRHNDNEKKNL
eukprot:scaffold8886_cov125-Isochrysis_galbana.AAC.2